jgi:hypothetical protein
MSVQRVVMVTGGSGLVGKAIQEVIAAEENPDEKWVYLSSKVRAVGPLKRAPFRSREKRSLENELDPAFTSASVACLSPRAHSRCSWCRVGDCAYLMPHSPRPASGEKNKKKRCSGLTR